MKVKMIEKEAFILAGAVKTENPNRGFRSYHQNTSDEARKKAQDLKKEAKAFEQEAKKFEQEAKVIVEKVDDVEIIDIEVEHSSGNSNSSSNSKSNSTSNDKEWTMPSFEEAMGRFGEMMQNFGSHIEKNAGKWEKDIKNFTDNFEERADEFGRRADAWGGNEFSEKMNKWSDRFSQKMDKWGGEDTERKWSDVWEASDEEDAQYNKWYNDYPVYKTFKDIYDTQLEGHRDLKTNKYFYEVRVTNEDKGQNVPHLMVGARLARQSDLSYPTVMMTFSPDQWLVVKLNEDEYKKDWLKRLSDLDMVKDYEILEYFIVRHGFAKEEGLTKIYVPLKKVA